LFRTATESSKRRASLQCREAIAGASLTVWFGMSAAALLKSLPGFTVETMPIFEVLPLALADY
jgi:hypothetical protein